jgi:tetratricopeptide (TPR) repeat protein
VDQERFAQGKRNYRSGDYAQAAQDFLESAEPGIARGNGSAFHQAGNAFMQLGRYKDALTMYQNALRDDTYDNVSSVYSNIGHVYSKEGNHAASAESYELAASYPECEKPYKCHLRAAQSHMKLKNIDKAALAYKKAALDVNNPDRSKALFNLALCFLELKQPLSAVESLKVALDFPDCRNRGKLFSSLGIAYSMLDSDDEAIEAFEHAIANLGEDGLTPVAAAAYAHVKARRSVWASAQPIIEESIASDVEDADPMSLTGEIQSIDTSHVDDSQVDVLAAMGTDEEVAQFFAMSEEELLEQGKLLAKVERKNGLWWKVLVGVIVGILALAAIAVGVAYYLGLGYPFAQDVVRESLRAYSVETTATTADASVTADAIAPYWTVSGQEAFAQMETEVPRDALYGIKQGVGKMSQSTVEVEARGSSEEVTILQFNLVRDGLGWKIKSVNRMFQDPVNQNQRSEDTQIEEGTL